MTNPSPYRAVILCGGSGSRLWPLSRELLPKQFIRLTDDRSLLQNTCCGWIRPAPRRTPRWCATKPTATSRPNRRRSWASRMPS